MAILLDKPSAKALLYLIFLHFYFPWLPRLVEICSKLFPYNHQNFVSDSTYIVSMIIWWRFYLSAKQNRFFLCFFSPHILIRCLLLMLLSLSGGFSKFIKYVNIWIHGILSGCHATSSDQINSQLNPLLLNLGLKRQTCSWHEEFWRLWPTCTKGRISEASCIGIANEM